MILPQAHSLLWMPTHMECKLEEKDPMNAVGNPFIFFDFKIPGRNLLPVKRSNVGVYSQICAKVLLMQSKQVSNCFATRSFNLALAS